MNNPIKFLLRFYLSTVLLFVVAKVVFMLACGAGHGLTMGDGLAVVAHGLTLDCSTAFYFLFVPFLLVLASPWCPGGWAKLLFRGHALLAAMVLAAAFVADTSLYPFWGFKLDATCLQYLDTPADAMASVSTAYIVVRLVLFVVLVAAIFSLLTWRSSVPRLKVRQALLMLLLVPIIIIGTRGGIDESTTNIGQVYFSQNQFLNHAAVNPVFSFISSMEKTSSVNTTYHFMADDECRQLIDSLYPPASSQTTDASPTLLNTRRPNVIIVLMESCGAMFMPVMPNLRRLADEGVSFTRCYGNSYRTDRGTVCTLSGYPSFPTMSVMKMPAKARTLPSIARSLQTEGYTTHYLYGGDINFTNMRGYLVATGFEQLTWKEDYTLQQQRTAQWGVRDDITFETLYSLVASQPIDSQASPYLIGYSTLSTHEPWDVPIHRHSDPMTNAFSYLDDCIGHFVERVRKLPQWDNLLLILLPDHSISFGQWDEQHPQRNLIPMVWTGGAVKGRKQIDVVCNQTDLPATLLAQMGIDHSRFAFSRNVTDSSYSRPFAIHTYNNGFSMADSSCFMVYDLDAQRALVTQGSHTDQLERMGKAILQAASKDLASRGTIEATNH